MTKSRQTPANWPCDLRQIKARPLSDRHNRPKDNPRGDAMLDKIKELVSRWRSVQEIDSLTDRDLDDLGMTRAQVTKFALMPHDVPDRLAAMAAIFDLSAADLKRDYTAYLDLLGTCGSCRDRAACTRVLARGDLSKPADCGFCPNAESFAELAA